MRRPTSCIGDARRRLPLLCLVENHLTLAERGDGFIAPEWLAQV